MYGVNMFTLELSNTITIKRYKCQWYSDNKRKYIAKTRILHADNMAEAKQKAIQLYDIKPDSILRV